MNSVQLLRIVHGCSRLLSRSIATTSSNKKIVPSDLKGKPKSSQEWLTRQLNDQYVKKSRYENYRCRSAFKLIEIDKRFKILRPGISVVECGAAPGSWTQVVVKKLNREFAGSNPESSRNNVIAVDLQFMLPVTGAVVLKEMDFTQPSVQDHIVSLLPNGVADVVLSDMSPTISGITDIDSVATTRLVYCALKFCLRVLKKDGTFLCKTWNTADVRKMVENMLILFNSVRRVKPNASRDDSSEIFLLARGFKGVHRPDPVTLDNEQ